MVKAKIAALPAFIAAAAAIAPEKAIDPIGKRLKHANPSIRAQVVRSLSEIANEDAANLLNEQLLAEEDIGVLRELVDRVKVTPESLSGFCKHLKHAAWPIRERVARALGEAGFGDPAITQALEEATTDEQLEVVQSAIESLGKISGESVESVLGKVLYDAFRPDEVRKSALNALTRLRQQQAEAERQYKYDVFLSYNSTDIQIVEALAKRLQEHLSPFFDRWHIRLGDPWQESLEAGLDNSRTCAVFIGPNKLSPWQHEELRSALDDRVRDKSFRVIPVLLPGANENDKDSLPRFLRRLNWLDFRSGLDDQNAFHRLVEGIRGEMPIH